MSGLREQAGWALAAAAIAGVALAATWSVQQPSGPHGASEEHELLSLVPGVLPPSATQPALADAPEAFQDAESEAERLHQHTGRPLVRCRVPLPPHTTLAAVNNAPGAVWAGHAVVLPAPSETQRVLLNASGAPIGHLRWQATPSGHACTWMRR